MIRLRGMISLRCRVRILLFRSKGRRLRLRMRCVSMFTVLIVCVRLLLVFGLRILFVVLTMILRVSGRRWLDSVGFDFGLFCVT